MQNKPNFQEVEIDANSVFTKDYENLWLYKSLKNKANSNPIFTPLLRLLRNSNKMKEYSHLKTIT